MQCPWRYSPPYYPRTVRLNILEDMRVPALTGEGALGNLEAIRGLVGGVPELQSFA
jgi:hypothetical protein